MKRLLMIWAPRPSMAISGGTEEQREELAKAFMRAYGFLPVDGPVIIEEVEPKRRGIGAFGTR